jgi:type IV secretion system protein VirB8
MDDLNRSISQEIKSGKYFINAHQWYANKFVYVIAERSYMAIIACCYISALLILGFYYMKIDPLAQQSSYLISLPDITKQYASIRTIGNVNSSPQLNVAKYMLEQYVMQREHYNFTDMTSELAGDRNFIKMSSSREIYLKYKSYISINNPYSPVMLYQNTNRVNVKVTEVRLLKLEHNATYSRAVIHYDSIARNLITNKTTTTKMAANINYQIDNAEKAIDKKRLNFLVLGYNIYKIKPN